MHVDILSVQISDKHLATILQGFERFLRWFQRFLRWFQRFLRWFEHFLRWFERFLRWFELNINLSLIYRRFTTK